MKIWNGLKTICAALAMLTALATAARASEPPLVFAAASLKNALDAVAAEWTKETGKTATISYAGSSILARQIEQGAPADIFISADTDWMSYLETRNLVKSATRADLLGNHLVLIAPAKSNVALTIAPGFDLVGALGPGRLAMADTKAVPAGKYGRTALERLGVWSSVENRLAEAENVRGALAFVARGETPLGIVYQTDAAIEPKVRIVATFPDDTHAPIVYPAAMTSASHNADAEAFLAFLSTGQARKIFRTFGFTPLR